ncbi:MAG: hypothetical protein WCQ66_06410 [Sphaerochaetaceae bacterium]
MSKRFVCLFLAFLLACPVFADKLPDYEPYQADEFPLWTYELRRGETLFFGSLAVTFPVTVLAYELINTFGGNLPTTPALDVTLRQAGVAAGISLGIAIADYLIGRIQHVE